MTAWPSYLSPGEVVTPGVGDANVLLGAPLGTLLLNQQIPNTRYGTPQQQPYDLPFHVQLVDIYEPNGPIDLAMLMLHGGAGYKAQYAAALGILIGVPSVDNVRWHILEHVNAAAWFAQGSHCTKANAGPWNPNGVDTVSAQYPNGVAGWSSHAYWSGADDPQFAKDVATAMRSRYGSVFRVCCGHSEGGMMTQRIWAEQSIGGFNCFCVSSGPANHWYLSNPTLPQIPMPFRAQFGLQDDNIGIAGGHFLDQTWVGSKNPTVSQAEFPVISISDFYRLQTRVDAYNTFYGRPAETVNWNDGVTVAAKIGTKTTWTYCGGAMQLVLYSDAQHSTKSHQACAGHGMFTDFAIFALQNIR
jgi:hypothetical protein